MANYITKAGLQKLKDELADIKNRQMPETKKLIAEARAFGDLKENAGYHDARDKMSFLLGRAEQLQIAINEAVITERSGEPMVEIGSSVSLQFGDKKESYVVVSPTESDILQNKISYESPLGKYLMGKKKGDAFDFLAGSKTVKVTVLNIA